MALLKGKQIQSIDASKVTETASKKFVTADQLTAIGTIQNKLEASDIADLVSNTDLSTTLGSYAQTSALSSYMPNASLSNYAQLSDGKISMDNIPAGAIEKCIEVADQTARYALTTTTAQLGDVIKQLDTGAMYIVISEADFSSESSYTTYTTATTWSAIENKPTSSTTNIDATVAKKDKIGYIAQKVITITSNGQTTINTGIKTDGTTSYFTDASFPIDVFLNSFLQKPGAGNDYTVAVVANELVITWLDADSLTLETTDEFVVRYTQLV